MSSKSELVIVWDFDETETHITEASLKEVGGLSDIAALDFLQDAIGLISSEYNKRLDGLLKSGDA